MEEKQETLESIFAEMREAAKSTDLFNGDEVGEPLIRGTKVEDWADRAEAAAERELSSAADDAASKATLDRTAKDAAEYYMAYAMAHNPAPQPGSATMRHALERILDIEGYGAPWIEAKVIAQKALEGEQCSPPPDQKMPKSEQSGNAAALREALKAAKTLLENTDFDADSDLDDAAAPVMAQIAVALAAPPRNCDRFATVDEAKAEWLRTNAKLLSSTGLMPFESWLFAPAEGKEASNV